MTSDQNALTRVKGTLAHPFCRTGEFQRDDLQSLVTLAAAAIRWAHALDEIHTKVFVGPGPHEQLDTFQATEHALRDYAIALETNIAL